MAQTGYTPISIYYSSTATNVPTAGNLVAGELAINTNDGVLYYKDSSGVVQSLASKTGNSGSFTNLAYTGTLTGGTGIVNLGSGQFYKDASGNVGIGTSSPNSYGAGYTTAQVNGSSGGLLQATVGGSTIIGELYASQGLGLVQVGTRTNHPLAFKTNSTEAMRINSSGTVSVGTTGGDIFNQSGVVLLGGTSPYVGVMHASGTASGSSYALFAYNAGIIGSISQAGTTGVLYNVTSDYRLKTVIGAVSDSGQRIDALQPIEYDWNTGGRTRGFLAHQFAEVYPNSVSGEKDAVNENGNPVYQGMQPSTPEVMADLIAEIQSLRKRVATLEAK